MPTHDPIAAARREAKTRSRKGGTTHQQALDAVAREAGHEHWAAMQAAHAAPAATIPPATSTRPARRLGVRLETAFWAQNHRSRIQTLSSARAGSGLEHPLRPLAFTPETVARLLSRHAPPTRRGSAFLAPCPLHDDANPSLTLAPSKGLTMKDGVSFACMAGCDAHGIEDAIVGALDEAIEGADAFMDANDRSRVVEGWAHGPAGVGGLGGSYRLEDGRRFDLPYASTAMLPEGYPFWWHVGCEAPIHALERELRAVARGHHRVVVAQEAGRPALAVEVWPERNGVGGYAVHACAMEGGAFGVRANWGDARPGVWDEIHDGMDKALARMTALMKECATTDPVEIAENETRSAREKAYMESIRGLDADGWGWFVGPDEDEFVWGGPYRTKAAAIDEGNGHCHEVGETYFVIHAKPDDDVDEDGRSEFVAFEKPIAVRSRD
jgi:hypothetical protein